MGCVWPCPGRMATSLSGLSLALCSSVPLATNLGKVWLRRAQLVLAEPWHLHVPVSVVSCDAGLLHSTNTTPSWRLW